MHNRKQFVLQNGVFSKGEVVKYGFPQGTVIGSVLFLQYINDLLNLNIIAFADDTAFIVEGNSWTAVRQKASVCFSVVLQWLNKNLLFLNINKTKYMPFAPYKTGLSAYDDLVIYNLNICNVNSNFLPVIVE